MYPRSPILWSTVRRPLGWLLCLIVCQVLSLPCPVLGPTPAVAALVCVSATDRPIPLSALRANLGRAIDSCLATEGFDGVTVGLHIAERSARARTVLSRNGGLPLVPASAIKVLTTGVAMVRLGGSTKIETPIVTDGVVLNGVVEGNLILVGRGDPCMRYRHLRAAVADLRAKGIYVVNGDIIADDSYFEREEPRFPPKARHYYAPPSATTLDGNAIRLKLVPKKPLGLAPRQPTAYARFVSKLDWQKSFLPGLPDMVYERHPFGDRYTISGTVTRGDFHRGLARVCVSRPALFMATRFREALCQAGVTVLGRARAAAPGRARAAALGTAGAAVVTTRTKTLSLVRSRPLFAAVKAVHEKSDNVRAEVLCRLLAAKAGAKPATAAAGLAVIESYCAEQLRFSAADLRLADACGLAHDNEMTARAFTAVLRHFFLQLGSRYVESLPRVGHHRAISKPLPPDDMKLYVKTGVLPVGGVNTAVGYLETAGGASYVFALLANRQGTGTPTADRQYVGPLLTAVIDGFTAAAQDHHVTGPREGAPQAHRNASD